MPSDLQVSNIRDLTNANSAISIASDGQVSITQNNPTVTLGSNTTFGSGVSLANATFPAGHILQVQYMSTSDQVQSTGSYVELLNGAYITITKIAGSNIFLSWSAQMGKDNNNVYTYGSKIERATVSNFSSLTTLPSSPQVAATEEPNGSVGFNNQSQYNYTGNWGHTTIDEGITSSAGTYYYRVRWRSQGSTVRSAIDSGVSTFYAMEIKA